MEQETFRADDLARCEWQYAVVHHSPNNFRKRQKVFLRSNPEMVLVVSGHDMVNNLVHVVYGRRLHKTASFSPEVLLDYTSAAFVVHVQMDMAICLN